MSILGGDLLLQLWVNAEFTVLENEEHRKWLFPPTPLQACWVVEEKGWGVGVALLGRLKNYQNIYFDFLLFFSFLDWDSIFLSL